jgi:glycosyltransferase involved in cell wall biosynthesis
VLEWKDHLVNYSFSLFRWRALRLEKQKNREADYVVVESGVLRDLLALSSVSLQKIVVAHNAVDSSEFARDQNKRVQVRNALGVGDQTVLVGYLGSYAFYHDTRRLVLAADIIRKQGANVDVKVLMMGSGKEYRQSRGLAEELGLVDQHVLMMPGVPQHEVPGVLSALDLAVLPGSTDIICPIKVQEYMACELPSVVPDYACNREVLRDWQTGLLFNPGDEAALAEKIALLAANRELRKTMGKHARTDALRRFSWEATWGAALEAMLTRVVARSGYAMRSSSLAANRRENPTNYS